MKTQRSYRAIIDIFLKEGQSTLVQLSLFPKALKSPFEGGLRGMTLLLMLILIPFTGFAQQPDSTVAQIDQYLQEAAQNNPELKAQFYEYRSVLEQAPQVGTLPDPEVMFMYFVNPRTYSNPLKRMTISVTQKFPWFGSLGTAEKKVQELAKARLATFVDSRNKLFKDIKEVWFHIYEVKHHYKILGKNLELLQTLESRAMTLYETGEIGQVDVIRLQMEKDKVNTRMQQMKDKLEPLRIKFNTLLNRAPQAEIRTPMPMEKDMLTLSPERILQKIRAQSPQLSSLDYRKKAAKFSLEKARLDGLPSFGVGVEAMLPNYMYMPLMPGERTSLVAKLSIKVPLYRDRYRAQKKEAKLRIRSIEQQKNHLDNTLMAQAERRLQAYRDAQYRVTLYTENLIPKTEQALEISMESYSTEAENFEELISLQQELLQHEMELYTAYIERNIAIAELEYLYGKYNINPEQTDY